MAAARQSQKACGFRAFKLKGLSSVNNTVTKNIVYMRPKMCKVVNIMNGKCSFPLLAVASVIKDCS